MLFHGSYKDEAEFFHKSELYVDTAPATPGLLIILLRDCSLITISHCCTTVWYNRKEEKKISNLEYVCVYEDEDENEEKYEDEDQDQDQYQDQDQDEDQEQKQDNNQDEDQDQDKIRIRIRIRIIMLMGIKRTKKIHDGGK